ncbi:MAG TPA: hypothetical protein VGB00_08845, partial [Pyrinomonadaceae bacterium]
MKKAALLLTILLCCIFHARAQERIEPEEYQIYKAWLEKPFIVDKTSRIFVMKFTADFFDDFTAMPGGKRRQLSRLQSSALKDYRARNRKPLDLTNNFGVNANLQLIPQDLHLEFRTSSSYAELAKKSGAEYGIAFSRVGFNKKKNQALIHVHYRSASSKLAFGYFFLFSKEKGIWTP